MPTPKRSLDDPAASGRGARRDSLFDERILRQYRPRLVSPPLSGRIAAGVLVALSAVTTCFAIAVALSLHVRIGSMLLLSGWLAALAIAAWFGPSWWRREVTVSITPRHVIWRRGRLRRFIDRREVSFARIHWHRSAPGVGDLELVRSVPTGALRRTLSITLPDLEAPDAVWAEIRGVDPSRVLGDGTRPVGQRLDLEERVLWTEKPHREPWDFQRWGTLAIACVCAVAGTRALYGGIHALQTIAYGGVRPVSATFGLLVVAIGISVATVLATSGIAAWHALVRPLILEHATRYMVTDRRVLIQRGSEELHLDRDRIVDVIDSPTEHGLHDLFLVLGAKNAHAHALAGAFGERSAMVRRELLPVLRGVSDSDRVRAILAHVKQAA